MIGRGDFDPSFDFADTIKNDLRNGKNLIEKLMKNDVLSN